MTIVLSTTIPATFGFSKVIISSLRSEGHRVILFSSNKTKLEELASVLGVEHEMIPFYRGMNPSKDVKAINLAIKKLKELKADVVVGATPKAAMVMMIAAKIAKVKTRIYHVYGLPFETAQGTKLKLLKFIEKLTGKFATHVIPIGKSVGESIISKKLIKSKKIYQHGDLTVGGVDIERFNPEKLIVDRDLIREDLGIKETDVVIGYVARFTKDKGFFDLVELWDRLKNQKQGLHLLLVGAPDEREPINATFLNSLSNENRVHNMGFREDVERFFAAMDIFVFPSYREGFGNVSIEASAMQIPVVTYDVTGCKDAVINNETGYVVKLKDIDKMESTIKDLIEDSTKRQRIGNTGRKRVSERFSLEKVSSNFIDTLREITPNGNL